MVAIIFSPTVSKFVKEVVSESLKQGSGNSSTLVNQITPELCVQLHTEVKTYL